MDALFLKLVNISIAAGWLVLAVIALRLILRKAPKAIIMILWGLVGIRLFCPFSLQSAFSLIPSAETIPQAILYADSPTIHTGISAVNSFVNPILSDSFTPQSTTFPFQVLIHTAATIWVIGILALAVYTSISYLRLRRNVQEAVLWKDNIWVCDHIATPFILGIFFPRIYLPSSLDPKDIPYVIAHEKAHLKRRDHWWKPIGYLLLTIYWFHPLLWVAYSFLCRDIELACDEKVIQDMGSQIKKPYAAALVNCSISHRMIRACPLAFGEGNVKERVEHMLNYKKPAFWIVMAALVSCVVLAVCFLTTPKEDTYTDAPFGRTYKVESVVYDAAPYSFTYSPETAPLYNLTADQGLMVCEDKAAYSWIDAGDCTEITLTSENFDSRFIYEDVWNEASAEQLRIQNLHTWEVFTPDQLENDVFYYILLQENGDVYLTYGYHTSSLLSSVYSTDYSIRWVFRLTPCNLLSVTASSAHLSSYVEASYFPGNFDFNYDNVTHSTILDEGTLTFHVGWDTDTVTVGEDYYFYPSQENCTVQKANYVLKRNKQGQFELPVARRGNHQDEQAYYFITGDRGKYVFRIDFPLDADPTPSVPHSPTEDAGFFFNGKSYRRDELSEETIQWLLLDPLERSLSSYFPPEFARVIPPVTEAAFFSKEELFSTLSRYQISDITEAWGEPKYIGDDRLLWSFGHQDGTQWVVDSINGYFGISITIDPEGHLIDADFANLALTD